MIILLLIIEMLIMMLIYKLYEIFHSLLYRIKIDCLLENINSREDLLYMRSMDYQNVIAEVFRRKGNKVKITDKCGEHGNGLIINDMKYTEIWKHGLNHNVDIEAGKKLAHHMQINSVCRGILVTLGDYKQNTKRFCHANVIECIDGEQLIKMCKEVQKRSEVFELTSD